MDFAKSVSFKRKYNFFAALAGRTTTESKDPMYEKSVDTSLHPSTPWG